MQYLQSPDLIPLTSPITECLQSNSQREPVSQSKSCTGTEFPTYEEDDAIIRFATQGVLSLNSNYASSPEINSDLITMANIVDEDQVPVHPSLSPDNVIEDTHLNFMDPLQDDAISLMSIDSQLMIDDLNEESSTLASCLQSSIEEFGLEQTAETILKHDGLKDKLMDILLEDANYKLRKSLRKSVLTSSQKKRSRKHFLSLTPKLLCQELETAAPESFRLIVSGLLGIKNYEDFYDSSSNTEYINVVAMVISTIAKTINRKATAYALLLTTVARDGGMREDSMKIFCNLVSPRTAQRYDTDVLSKGWDSDVKKELLMEALHFAELLEAETELKALDLNSSERESVLKKVQSLRATIPPQIQIVWDNLNLRTKHRYERKTDCYAEYNFDWMACLLIKERMSANHMKHELGHSLKDPNDLQIEDFTVSEYEKAYIFERLVSYYAYRLVQRHPQVFGSIQRKMKVTRLGCFYVTAILSSG